MAFGVVAAVATTVATVSSISQGRKARKSQAAANEAQKKINRLRNEQQRRLFLRGFRQAQANALLSGVASGASLESSGVQGTLASENTQRILALKEFQQFDELGEEFISFSNRASRQASQSQQFGQIANFAGRYANFDSIAGLFKKPDTGGNSGTE